MVMSGRATFGITRLSLVVIVEHLNMTSPVNSPQDIEGVTIIALAEFGNKGIALVERMIIGRVKL